MYLAIEISDSTLRYDRQTKTVLYAEYQVPEVWIINVKRNELEVYRKPGIDGYGSKESYSADQAVACLEFPNDPIHWWS